VPLVSTYVYGTDTDVSACLPTIYSTSSAEDDDQGINGHTEIHLPYGESGAIRVGRQVALDDVEPS